MLVASACGDSDGFNCSDTAVADAAEAQSGDYKWTDEQGSFVDVPAALDCIRYEATGDAPAIDRQPPCPDCGQPLEDVLIPDVVTAQCDNGQTVAYEAKQLIANSKSFAELIADHLPELQPTDVTPVLELGRGEADYEPPEDFRLYQIDLDPIEALAALDPDVVAEFQLSPNYVFVSAPGWKFGPGDRRVPAKHGPLISPLSEEGKVAVIDDFSPTNTTDPVSGHGQFVSNLVEALGPNTIEVDAMLKVDGNVWSSTVNQVNLGGALQDAAAQGANVINLSLGTYPCFAGGVEYKPTWLLSQIQALPSDIEVVAAAGNDSHGQGEPLFYPAGFSEVVSVGAAAWSPADGKWRAADFTNKDFVTVWAPGVAVVSEIDGDLWQWSGTSFASPMFAACLAAGDCSVPVATAVAE